MAWSSYATICRLCLQQDGYLLAIFNNHAGDAAAADKSIQRKIVECTMLELSSGDGLPPCICHRCLYKVELCLEFKQQCLMSDATLRQIKCQMSRKKDCSDGGSDQDSEENYQDRHMDDQFSQDQAYRSDNVDSVVMVVDPTMDYDSENDSDENADISEFSDYKNVFMCKYCDRAYTEHEQCNVHETSDHNNEVPYMCNECSMGFADRTNHTAHLKSVHQNDKPFSCPQCPRSFSRRSDLRKHTVVHTGIKPFTCNVCMKSFSRNTNLTKHMRIHSGQKPYICPQCPKTFISKGDLTRHALIHTGHKPFACSFCDQTFGRRDKLLRHVKKHYSHGDAQNMTELEMLRQQIGMDFNYDMKQELDLDDDGDDDGEENWNGENMVINLDPFNHQSNYINVGENLSPLKEDENSQQSPERELPRIPVHIEHSENDLPRIPEHITGDSYPEYGSNIKKQMETVSVMKKYPCLVCNKRFSSADALRFHMVTHSGQRPHPCTLCSKAFLRKRELDRHMGTHTGMKPFKCVNCDKRFGRKDKLVRHMRIHEVSKAHVCQLCGTAFTRRDALVHHMKMHSAPEEVVL